MSTPHFMRSGMVIWAVPSDKAHSRESIHKHNSNGPALVVFNTYGVPTLKNNSCEFWLFGKKTTYKKFKEHYMVIHLKEYPYGSNELDPDVLKMCRKHFMDTRKVI